MQNILKEQTGIYQVMVIDENAYTAMLMPLNGGEGRFLVLTNSEMQFILTFFIQ